MKYGYALKSKNEGHKRKRELKTVKCLYMYIFIYDCICQEIVLISDS